MLPTLALEEHSPTPIIHTCNMSWGRHVERAILTGQRGGAGRQHSRKEVLVSLRLLGL